MPNTTPPAALMLCTCNGLPHSTNCALYPGSVERAVATPPVLDSERAAPPVEGLPPCPFCRSSAFVSWDGDVNHPNDWSIQCDNTLHCGAAIGGMNSEVEAIEAWSRRTPQDEVAEALAELREMFPDDDLRILKSVSTESEQNFVIIFWSKHGSVRNPAQIGRGATLTEAMAAARQWKQEQGK